MGSLLEEVLVVHDPPQLWPAAPRECDGRAPAPHPPPCFLNVADWDRAAG